KYLRFTSFPAIDDFIKVSTGIKLVPVHVQVDFMRCPTGSCDQYHFSAEFIDRKAPDPLFTERVAAKSSAQLLTPITLMFCSRFEPRMQERIEIHASTVIANLDVCGFQVSGRRECNRHFPSVGIVGIFCQLDKRHDLVANEFIAKEPDESCPR